MSVKLTEVKKKPKTREVLKVTAKAKIMKYLEKVMEFLS